MKNLAELSYHQMVNLSNQAVDEYVKIAMAEEGIPLSMTPPKTSEAPKPVSDGIVYEVGDYLFNKKTTAEKFSDILSNLQDEILKKNYDFIGNEKLHYPQRLIDTYNGEFEFVVKKIRVYSKEARDSYKAEKKEYDSKTTQEETKAYSEEYSEWSKKVYETRASIYNQIREARDHIRDVSKILETFDEFAELSEGNTEVAMRFFHKRYPNIENVISILNEPCGDLEIDEKSIELLNFISDSMRGKEYPAEKESE